MKKKLVWILILVMAIAGAGGYLYYRHEKIETQKRRDAYVRALNELTISFRDELKVNEELEGTSFTPDSKGGKFEYGTAAVDPMVFVDTHGGNLTIKGAETVDTTKLGEYDVFYVLNASDEYGTVVTREVPKVFT
ncbi:MAG: hypothetical protein II510_03650, partial [Erysipelotrichales bacterium]|nr:hypothetical protein [Erysipelotrichales bacterium]